MSSKSKSKPKPSSSQSTQKQGALLILQYNARRVLIRAPEHYAQLEASVRRHLTEIPADHVLSYHTDELSISNGVLVEVPEEVWGEVREMVSTLTVQANPRAGSSSASSSTSHPVTGGQKRVKKDEDETDTSCDESNAPPSKKLRRSERRACAAQATASTSASTSTSTAASASISAPVPASISPTTTAAAAANPATTSAPSTSTQKKKLTITIHQIEGNAIQLQCSPSTSTATIFSLLQKRFGLDPPEWRLRHGADGPWLDGRECGKSWKDWEKEKKLVQKKFKGKERTTLGEYGVKDGDELWVYRYLIGGKPVIYVLPPTVGREDGEEMEVSVRLELVPEWRFSAVYPVLRPNDIHSKDGAGAGNGQVVQWDVKARKDGTLLETNTGLEVAYLFWEAEALKLPAPAIPLTPTASENSEEETFVPTHPHLDPSNSVVLEVAHITPYLDSALKALGLHVEARTSFITYWLPALLKHTHIALRFLPQRVFARAAPLTVSPAPDVVLRVFMLFKGLTAEDVGQCGKWRGAFVVDQSPHSLTGSAAINGFADPERWRSIVGVDGSRRMDDGRLFRVLEWGGMEVVSPLKPCSSQTS